MGQNLKATMSEEELERLVEYHKRLVWQWRWTHQHAFVGINESDIYMDLWAEILVAKHLYEKLPDERKKWSMWTYANTALKNHRLTYQERRLFKDERIESALQLHYADSYVYTGDDIEEKEPGIPLYEQSPPSNTLSKDGRAQFVTIKGAMSWMAWWRSTEQLPNAVVNGRPAFDDNLVIAADLGKVLDRFSEKQQNLLLNYGALGKQATIRAMDRPQIGSPRAVIEALIKVVKSDLIKAGYVRDERGEKRFKTV